MELGIVGLPFSGKTTLFCTITGQEPTATHKLEAHRGVVKVPDSRLDRLVEIFQTPKKIYTTIEYIEVSGLEKDAAHGKGFDPQFLAILKNTDALCLVLRSFEDEYYPHAEGSIDPVRDLQIVESEFILSDLAIIENRLSRLTKQIQQSKSEEDIREKDLLENFKQNLEQEIPLRELDISPDDRTRIRGYQFLSAKPLLIVVNYAEGDITREDDIISLLAAYQSKKNIGLTGLCAKIEFEISN